ncbi:hypothetical protein J1N35_010562 [Gossypium stocksii]|uniref:Reverse transcriptase n=1 Tax=Gossypium stocksii TaxID=47602 RepID=A0A9D3W0N4_9ROSI|nr:hypothetical protein J1N35_010562 [Gossypium stocksii]
MDSFEKKGGRLRPERQMTAFREVLDECGLIDLGFVGRWLMWERGRFLSTNIQERLDRGVATSDCISLFPCYRVEHFCHSFSDHCPILLDTNRQSTECLENDFEEVVKSSWEDLSGNIPEKLMMLGYRFHLWSRGRRKKQRVEHMDLEERLQALCEKDPSDEILAEITEVQIGLNLEMDKEELFWE